ncbi:equilibrative nucleoside transporter 1 [Drosophila grimshawi]|uniref:GH13844 n=1 Tax=Drosophila grimshawi TaxID=7222 RepID=B4JRA1_DROGR|nr:equilibrative nucleoside transporter 1 [Drosophila grimshawi]EDV99431.1 GH13844 [Drosophila grimshawi]
MVYRKNEERPFIGNKQSVTLQPSWESKIKEDPDRKGSGSMMSKIVTSLQPPVDKYKLVFLIFMLHGLGTLMPWNMFITAKSYFEDFKLGENYTVKSEVNYRGNFMQNMGFASQIPNVLFNWLNIFVNFGGDLTSRIVYSILMEIVILIITVVLAMLDSSEWPGIFFWLTMTTIVLINMCNGVYQSSIYGLVASLPPKYTGAVVLGSNVSGCFATIMSILCATFFTSMRTAAIYYFVTAILVLLFCFDTYFALPLNKFFRHYETVNKYNEKKSDSKTQLNVPYWQIFKKASPQLFNVFFTFFVTLSVFPAMHSDIKRTENFVIEEKYFTQVTCFLTFNVFAMLGSLTTSWIQWPKPKYLVVPVVLRAIFIPLFLFCNYQPKDIVRTLPVFITNEWIYWIIAIIMSYSSGYLSSLGMIYSPQTVSGKYQITAGMFAAAFLVTGIFSGVLFAYLNPLIVQL